MRDALERMEIVASTVKVAPPAVVSMVAHVNDNMPSVVLWLTAIYTLMMILHTLQKIRANRSGGTENV